jgi:hypothetical protein
VCYTLAMDQNHHIWRDWSDNLHRWGVQSLAAAFLEAAGPLATFGAQAVYLSQPFLRPLWPEDHWQALIALLEDSKQAEQFTALLRDQEAAA